MAHRPSGTMLTTVSILSRRTVRTSRALSGRRWQEMLQTPFFSATSYGVYSYTHMRCSWNGTHPRARRTSEASRTLVARGTLYERTRFMIAIENKLILKRPCIKFNINILQMVLIMEARQISLICMRVYDVHG